MDKIYASDGANMIQALFDMKWAMPLVFGMSSKDPIAEVSSRSFHPSSRGIITMLVGRGILGR